MAFVSVAILAFVLLFALSCIDFVLGTVAKNYKKCFEWETFIRSQPVIVV